MSIRTRIFLLVMGLIATLISLAVVVINRVVVEQARERLIQQLTLAEPLYRSVWETRTRLLVEATQAIAGTAYVKRVLGLLYETRDPAAARATIRDMARDLLGRHLDQADLLFVVDGDGRIIVADTLKVSVVSLPARFPVVPPLHAGGRPVPRVGFELLENQLFQFASVPVLLDSADRQEPKVLAILATGYRISPEFVTALANVTGGHVLIFVGRTLHASTLPSSPSHLDFGSMGKGLIQKVEVGGKQYVAFHEPLQDLTGLQIGSVVLLQSLESAVQLARSIQRWFILLGTGVVLVGGILTFLLTRAVVTPLMRLDRAAAELGRGNYDYEIGISGRDEVGRLAKTFHQMRASLQTSQRKLLQSEKLAAMGSLLAGVAHELNNPLSVVTARAYLLRSQSVGNGSLMEQATKIIDAANHCARIVTNFLALARQHPPERTQVLLNQIVHGALELLAYPLKTDNVAVRLDLASDIPVIWADPHQLHQVLVNLIVNAHQAMRESPLPRRLFIASQSDPARRRVRLEVADTGPGIPPEIEERIFEPFFTTKLLGQGTGLGLSLCRGIIENHGGTIAVKSQLGRGAVFAIELPVQVGSEATPEAREAETTPPGPGKAILVVDDEPEVRQVLVDILTADGHQVGLAANGARALDKLGERAYDLILSDVRMPELNGLELYHEINYRYPSLRGRFVILTGDTLNPGIKEFVEQNGVQALSKPFVPEEVLQMVRKVLR